MTFTFYTNIPGANNNPSDDQPDMLQNNVTIDSALAVDHQTFNDGDCGKHKQITFYSQNTPAAQTDPASTMYTAAGAGSNNASSNSQALFVNEDNTFMVTPVRAFCTWTTISANDPTTTIDNGYNVDTIATTGSGENVTVTLSTNAVTGNNAVIIISNELGSTIAYSFTNPNITFTLTPAQRNSVKTDIIVLQA